MATLLLGSRARIPRGVMDVCFLCLYVVLSRIGRGFCDELIPRPKESYQVSNKDS
jgi:hypothetical protein